MIDINIVRNVRREIDQLANTVKELRPVKTFSVFANQDELVAKEETALLIAKVVETSSIYTDECYSKLMYAKAWLGKMLEHMGSENPYPAANEVSKIPPTQDVQNAWEFEPTLPYLNKINFLREGIESTHNNFFNLIPGELTNTQQQVSNYLREAKFALGFELARLKKEEDDRRED